MTFLQVENAATASVKVAELTSKLQEHEHIAGERDVLNEQVLQLQKELQAAQSSIDEQVNVLSFVSALFISDITFSGFFRTL